MILCVPVERADGSASTIEIEMRPQAALHLASELLAGLAARLGQDAEDHATNA